MKRLLSVALLAVGLVGLGAAAATYGAILAPIDVSFVPFDMKQMFVASILAGQVTTYADVAKALDPNGKVDKLVEILRQKNAIIDDAKIMMCNDGTGHKTTVRTGLPEATWRLLNYGVGNVKTTRAQVRDTTGMLEIYSEIDKSLADLNGNSDAYRLSEAKGIIQGMNHQMASTVIYGNVAANPERFMGLAPRYNSLSGSVASSRNVIDAGGSGNDLTSIWLVGWGEQGTHLIFPNGSKAGLSQTDLGEQTLKDAAGGQYQGYREHFKWDVGLSVRDWRANVRIANIEVSDMIAGGDAALKLLVSLMIDAMELVEEDISINYVWYMNRTMRSALRKAILNKVANNLTEATVAGKVVTSFDNVAVRRVDAILNTEAEIS